MKNIFKRIISIALIGLLSLCIMCGCSTECYYQSFHETEEVVEINIVFVKDLYQEMDFSDDTDITTIIHPGIEVIKTIDMSYFNEIVADVSSVKFTYTWNQQSQIDEMAIQIRYSDGQSDIIYASGLAICSIGLNEDGTFAVNGNGSHYVCGLEYAECDEPEKMQAIIDKWMNM